MNQVHKVIWSRVKNCYIVVSEITKRVGRDNKASVTGIRPLRALLCAMVIAGCMLPADADAAPGLIHAGTGATASGDSSIAYGYSAQAKKDHSIAQGTGADAEEEYALAMGYKAIAKGLQSLAIGRQAFFRNGGQQYFRDNGNKCKRRYGLQSICSRYTDLQDRDYRKYGDE